MQVVIEIPDNIYEMVMNTGTYGCYRFNSTKAIKKGIPLPKGYGRLIDADALIYEAETCIETTDAFIELTKNAPTVIEADKSEDKK